MIFMKCSLASLGRVCAKTAFSFIAVMLLSIQLAGCTDQVSLPSELQLARFEKNGPDLPAMGMHRLLTARMHEAPLPGEVLEITMPLILQVVTTDEPSATEADAPYLSRVSATGTITLPAVGELEVAGKTLAQIESSIIDAYYPEFTQTRPSVFVRLAEEQGLEQPLFTVLGLVNRPGNFPYPPSVRYNIMQALGFAGGLDRATDPRFATVYRLTPDGTVVGENFAVAGDQDNTNLTHALSTLVKPGDIVVVEHTPRTRTKEFLDRTFRLSFGTYWSLRAPWED
jgi:protein involved in polysaccharide export with SLBB domain